MNQDTNARRLEQLLQKTPGTLSLPTKIALTTIRETMKKKVAAAGKLSEECDALLKMYTSMLQRANNAVSGGGQPSTFLRVWSNFITAAIALAECLNKSA
jgi:hypothetical protein